MKIYNHQLECGCLIADDTGTKEHPDGNAGLMPCYAEWGDMKKKKDREHLKLHNKCTNEFFGKKEIESKCSHPYYHYDKEGIRRCTVCNEKVKLKGYYEIGFESKIFKVPKEFLNKYKEEVIQHTKDKVFDELIAKSYDFNEHKLPVEEIRESKKKHLKNQKKSE